MPAHPGPSQKKSLPRITQAKVQSHSCCNSVAIVGACGQTQTVRDLLAEGDGRSPPSDQCFCLGRPAPPLGYTENRASTGFVAIYRICGHLPDLWPSTGFVAIHRICGHQPDLWPSTGFVAIYRIYGHLPDLWPSTGFVAIYQICGYLPDLWPSTGFVAIYRICGHLPDLWPSTGFVAVVVGGDRNPPPPASDRLPSSTLLLVCMYTSTKVCI